MGVEGTWSVAVVSLLSIVVRVAAVYVFLLVLVRMAGKREAFVEPNGDITILKARAGEV